MKVYSDVRLNKWRAIIAREAEPAAPEPDRVVRMVINRTASHSSAEEGFYVAVTVARVRFIERVEA